MTVVVNGMIITILLWHLTAMTLLVGLALALGGIGLTVEPGSGVWWVSRPIWMAVYASGLAVLSLLFARFERPSARAETPAAVWRQIAGAALVCFGLALLALDGVGGDGWLGLRIWVLLLPFAGAALLGLAPLGSLVRR